MDRASARALAKSALDATTSYTAVYDHEPTALDVATPVATIHSKSLGLEEFAHGEIKLVGMLWISLYVLRDDQPGAAVEAQIDTLAREALLALREVFAVGDVDATIKPSDSGYVELDSKAYRLERFTIRVEEELEDPA